MEMYAHQRENYHNREVTVRWLKHVERKTGENVAMVLPKDRETGLDIRLVDAVARGASRFENLLAPPKTYWPLKKLTGPFPKTKLVR